MALSRALWKEFRPFFRMMEDPFAVDPAFSSFSPRQRSYDPFNWYSTTPALNLSEEDDHYIVEAELPGVKKENLDLRIGDGGRSLTIEGKVIRGGGQKADVTSPQPESLSTAAADAAAPSTSQSTAVTKTQGRYFRAWSRNDPLSDTNPPIPSDKDKQLTENSSWDGVRTFTRTVWLPHRIDSNAVKAKLDHGILTVTAPKAKDVSVNVAVE